MRKFKIYHCNRCGYEWVGRTDHEPKECPHCKSIWWNKKRKYRIRSVQAELDSLFEEANA